MGLILKIFSIPIVRLSVALLLLIFSNIALGSFNSWFDKSFDKEKMLRGIKKGLVVFLVFVLVYIAGVLVPEIQASIVNGEPVNLTTGVLYIITAGFLWYAKEVLTKISVLIGGKLKIKLDEVTFEKDKEP